MGVCITTAVKPAVKPSSVAWLTFVLPDSITLMVRLSLPPNQRDPAMADKETNADRQRRECEAVVDAFGSLIENYIGLAVAEAQKKVGDANYHRAHVKRDKHALVNLLTRDRDG